MSRFKTVLTTKSVLSIFAVIVISGTVIWFVGWMLYDILGFWKWFTPSVYRNWLLAIYRNWLLAILTIYTGYLIFRYVRREGPYEKLQKLVRQRVRKVITEKKFEKRLKELEEKSDVDTRARIKEYLPHIIAWEEAIAYADEQKMKKK